MTMLLGFLGCLGALKEVKAMLLLVSGAGWGGRGTKSWGPGFGGGGGFCCNFLGQPRHHVVSPHPALVGQQRGAGGQRWPLCAPMGLWGSS